MNYRINPLALKPCVARTPWLRPRLVHKAVEQIMGAAVARAPGIVGTMDQPAWLDAEAGRAKPAKPN
jgi:hypothetical protein